MSVKQNWFDTLNQSLDSEKLVELWPFGTNIGYGQNVRVTVQDGSNERLISVYRNDNGRYERPVHYKL